MKIGRREVGPGAPVFIIAECGSNHGCSYEAALALIDAAADAGADAAKFQYFRVDRFLVPRENPKALRRYELPDEWLPKLRARCDERGIEFLCTAFDLESLDVVDPYVNAHKVGSYEAANDGYLAAVGGRGGPSSSDYVPGKGKPFLISNGVTGMQHHGYCVSSVTLQCVSKYPAPVAGYLSPHPYSQCAWGISDHTLDPTTVPAAAVALGACVVEKHMRLTFDKFCEIEHPGGAGIHKHDQSPDNVVSIFPDDFTSMVRAIRATESAVRG
ncbi:MAG: N-acetylneuraminate synthase family protein [Betaproteobacteria bacterium]|nr:N-acetylneuraminate synthase family protein [Betaproteobacteria bacterium]